jgi:hypothetical protein
MDGIDAHLHWCAQRGLRDEYLRVLRCTLVRVTRDVGPLRLASETMLSDWFDACPVGAGARRTYLAHLSSYYRWLIWTARETDLAAAHRPRFRDVCLAGGTTTCAWSRPRVPTH